MPSTIQSVGSNTIDTLSPPHTVLCLPPVITFKLSPVHSFTSSSHCLAGLPLDLFLHTLPGKMVLVRIPFALIKKVVSKQSDCESHLPISSSGSYFKFPMCSAIIV